MGYHQPPDTCASDCSGGLMVMKLVSFWPKRSKNFSSDRTLNQTPPKNSVKISYNFFWNCKISDDFGQNQLQITSVLAECLEKVHRGRVQLQKKKKRKEGEEGRRYLMLVASRHYLGHYCCLTLSSLSLLFLSFLRQLALEFG